MNISLTSDDAIRGIITVAIEKKDYEDDVDRNLRLYRRRMALPGFRKGTAPLGMIRKVYGRRVMAEEINRITTESLFRYIRDNKMGVLGEPLPRENQEPINFESPDEIKIQFDVALSPKKDLSLTKDDHLTLYNIYVDDEALEKQIDSYRSRQGTSESVDSVELDDWINGKLVEMENGEQKPGGLWREYARLSPKVLQDEAERAKFIGAKPGDSIIFNPQKAYGNNKMALESLTQLDGEALEHFTNDCRFEIDGITRSKLAEMTPDFFAAVLGRDDITDEQTFREELRKSLTNPLPQRAETRFESEMREMMIKKVGEVTLADDILKRWLVLADRLKPEDVDKNYPGVVEDMKYHIAKEYFMSANGLTVEDPDIEEMSKLYAREQIMNYGVFNPDEEMVEQLAKDLLKRDENRRNLISRATDKKLAEWVKGQITVDKKDIALNDYDQLMWDDMLKKLAEHADKKKATETPQAEA